MAGEVEKLSGKLGIDTTDFKTAIGAANRELRVLESGFKAGAAALGDWASSATGLESRVKSLTSQIDIQKLKVDALRAEHERLAQENGASSRAAQDAEIKLNKETETLGRMQNELNNSETALQQMKSGEEEAGNAAEEMGGKVEESGSKIETFKGVMNGVGTVIKGAVTAVVALGAAAISAVAGLAGLAFNTASTAEKIQDLSNQTGISTTRLQELQFAGEIVGTSLETITGANARLIRSMASAKDGTGSQADAFKALGISVTDANGNLRDNQEVFSNVIDALGAVQNPAERDALAMQLLGKGAQELNPLIKAGSSELARLSEEAHKMGAVMSEEDVAAAGAFKDQLDALKMGFQGVVAQIGLAFIPGLSGIATQGKGYLEQLVNVVQGSGGDVGKMASGLGGLLGKIATDIASQLPQLMQVGLGIIQAIITSLVSALPTLLPAVIDIINTLVTFLVQSLPMLIDAGVQILLTLVDAIVQNLPMLIGAALQAIIALANGLAAALPTLIPAVVQAIITIVTTLVENIPMLIGAALALILGLAQGLIAAIPILIPAIPQIIQAIVDALIVALPMIGAAALELIKTLASGIVSNLPLIGKTAIQIIDVLGKGIADLTSNLLEVGKNLLEGIWQGIVDNADWFYNQISEFFSGIIDEAKKALGISSPSKYGIAIGRNLMTSTALGASQELVNVERYFNFAFGRLATAGAAISGAGGPNISNQNDSFQFFGPVIVQGETPAESFGASLKMKRF